MKGQILEYKGAKYKLRQQAYISDCGTVYQAECHKMEDIESENNYPLEAHFVYWNVSDSYDAKTQEEDEACDWKKFEIV